MSKALEENGGVTPQQTPECTCGFAQRIKLERRPPTTTGRRSSLDNQKGGSVQANNSAPSGASSSRAAPAAAPSVPGVRVSRESGRIGDAAASSATPSVQGVRVSRESGRNGDVKSSSVNASSTSLQGERKSRDRAKSGDVQQPKSPLGNGSPSFREARSSRDSRRSGDEQQQVRSPSADAQPAFQWESSLRDSRRSGDVQQQPPKSPSGNGSPSSCCHEDRSRRSGNLLHTKSLSGTTSPGCQGERSLRGTRSPDVPTASSPSVDASPSFREGKSLRDNSRSGNARQAETPSVDGSQPTQEGTQEGKSVRGSGRNGDVGLLKSPAANGTPSHQAERSCRDERRIDDEERQPKSTTSGDASPSHQRVRSSKDSLRGVDVPLFRFPSSSRESPATPSSYFNKWGSFGESLRTGGAHGNSAPTLSTAGAAPDAPSPTCPSLKSKLVAGQKLYGAFLVSFSTVVAEILGWAGYDFVVVDFDQLFPGDLFAALPVLQALASTGTPVIFRLRGDDPILVNKALDMGPAGLMFAMIEDEEAARNAVAFCKYPPRGTRRGSRHMLSRASRYGLDPSYMDRLEEDLLVICQVETMDSLDHIMEIAGVEGVDCIQIGGLDCGVSLGDPYIDYNKEKILERQQKVLLAGIATPENSPDALFKRGYRLVSGAVDVVLLRNAALADLRRNKPSFNT